ncbi:MFS transporter [Pusillimonas noertemannii]|uniref:MFS transporter n=1 Tax=Pusillimonas noertemannii TaxID=305977 RepID=UPI0002D623B8|nr:MFS transporter [Pusillimonas noertemannii]
MQPSSINVSNLIDTRDLSGYNVKIMAWCFFIMLFDGFDLGVLSFAAPSILREWAVTNPAAMGSVFSASIMGILVGSLMFGYIGDRFGRRNAIIVALTTVGLSSLAVTIVDTLTHLFWLRFITGLGLGGLFPNVAALGAEFAPKKYRATLLILGLMGVTFGVAVPGILATHMVPVHGWQSLFFVGGIGPLLMAVACFIGLPESPMYLVLKENGKGALIKILRKLKPDLSVDEQTRFVTNDKPRAANISPRELFKGGLGVITALLWLCFAANLMGYFFLISWLPTLLQGAAHSAADSNFTTILLQLGGITGGILLCRPMDRMGVLPLLVLFLVAMVSVGAIGSIDAARLTILQIAVFVAGLSTISLQFGLDAFAAMLYRTPIRGVGTGWAFLFGRVGSVLGPILGGMLIARKVPIDQLFLAAAVPFAVGSVAALILLAVYRRRASHIRSEALESAGASA